MANIIFTNKCNINCPFCFAAENNSNATIEESNFSVAETWDILNFSNSNQFRFCGGEPSQHPEIIKTIDLLLKSKKNVFIMTNGIWPANLIEYISKLHPKYLGNVSYLFNILPPKYYKPGQLESINNTLSVVNNNTTTLGMTIFDENFEYEYLINIALKYNISKLRWSVTAPNISGPKYRLEKHFNSISQRIYQFLLNVRQEGLTANCDCGYIPPCFFNKDHLLDLVLKFENPIRFLCKGSSVDIDNKGNAWRCYGLYSVLRGNIKDFQNEDKLNKYFTNRVELLDNLYPYKECKSCDYWQKSCTGGCYAIRIKKMLEKNPSAILFPIDDDNEILQCKPYRSKGVQIVSRDNDPLILINDHVINNPDSNKIEYLKEINGILNINDLIEKWKNNFSSYEKAKKEVIEMTRSLFEKGIIKINYEYNIDIY